MPHPLRTHWRWSPALLSGLFATACAGTRSAAEPRPVPTPSEPVVLLHEDGVENAYPRLSPDGTQVLYQSNRTGTWQIFVMDVAARRQVRLTHDDFDNNFVDWSPDGQWIAFVSNRDGNEEIYRMRADGSGLERLTEHAARDIHPYFSPDGRSLLFNSTRANGSLDVFRLALAERTVHRLTEQPLDETCARYAPDMQSFVVLQNGRSHDDLFLVDVATGTTTNMTNTPRVRDGWPAFSPDGRWIYYSTLATGRHCIHRMRTDGTGDERVTDGGDGIEDGRAVVGADGTTVVFNRRRSGCIDIMLMRVAAAT